MLMLFDFYNACFPCAAERVYLPRCNPLESYDEKKFRERFRLSKPVVRRLLDEVNKHTIHSTTVNFLFCRCHSGRRDAINGATVSWPLRARWLCLIGERLRSRRPTTVGPTSNAQPCTGWRARRRGLIVSQAHSQSASWSILYAVIPTHYSLTT